MKMNSLHRVAASIVALVSVFAAISCVQQEYEISEDNLNLEVTVFQEGTEIPLGSTGELNMEDLMESFGQSGSSEYLKATGENGEYFFEMSETLDLAECLKPDGCGRIPQSGRSAQSAAYGAVPLEDSRGGCNGSGNCYNGRNRICTPIAGRDGNLAAKVSGFCLCP